MPAKRVDIVLYRHDVLAENNEHDSEADWEIVSVNASPTEEETPIKVGTLLANHYGLSGGTATNLSAADFVAMLRKSVLFWKDKANAAPVELKEKFKS
jgi:predicted sugar kinase